MAEQQAADVFLTDEVRTKLKGFMGFQVNAAFKYVPKVFRENGIPKELCPVWTLKSKNGIEATQVEDGAGYLEMETGSAVQKFRPQSGSMRLATLRKGIIGVDRFLLEDGTLLYWDAKSGDMTTRDADGSEHKSSHVIVDKIIERMTQGLQIELQNAINERDVLTAEELRGLE